MEKTALCIPLHFHPIVIDEPRKFSRGAAQHVEWDLNKTSKTLTETLMALFLMA